MLYLQPFLGDRRGSSSVEDTSITRFGPTLSTTTAGGPLRALSLATPIAAARDPVPIHPGNVRRRDLLGGLIHEYHGLAA